MKTLGYKLYALCAVVLVLTLGGIVLAGDDYTGAANDVTTNTSTSSCTPLLRANKNYAFRCTTDTYGRVTSDTTNAGASNKDQVLSANKLYDLPTTSDQRNACFLALTAAGSCYVYIHRERNE
jgi:hypothetical protein